MWIEFAADKLFSVFSL